MSNLGSSQLSKLVEQYNTNSISEMNTQGDICDRILENHLYGHNLHIKYLAQKSSLKILFLFMYGSNTVKMKITRKSIEIFKMCFVMSARLWQTQKFYFFFGALIRAIFKIRSHLLFSIIDNWLTVILGFKIHFEA